MKLIHNLISENKYMIMFLANNDTKSKQKATLYSNYWVNILSMKCQYPEEIMKQIEKYKPTNDIYDVKL